MHYDKEYDIEMNPWMKYCRGAVIDINKHKVICIPPQKARQTNNLEKMPIIFSNL